MLEALENRLAPATLQAISLANPSLYAISAGASSSTPPSVSDDGRFVAFESTSGNVVPGDNNNANDVFVRDFQSGTTTLVSVTAGGTSANAASYHHVMTPDGRYVAFDSLATNLTVDATYGHNNVFVRDLQTGTTTLVSMNGSSTGAGDNDSLFPEITSNGRYVLFKSSATNLLPGQTIHYYGDLYVRDLVTNTTTLVSVNTTGTDGSNNGTSDTAYISPDGRYVTFHSQAANLVSGFGDGTNENVFLRDLVAGLTTPISVASSGGSGNNNSYFASVSNNGRYVTFESSATNLVNGGTSLYEGNIYQRDLVAGTTALVSVNPSGRNGNSSSIHSSTSSDGRYVAFESYASDLVSGDNNNNNDVFVRDMVAGITALVSVNSSGSGSANGFSDIPKISRDGSSIAFESFATNLVSGMTQSSGDEYLRNLATGTTSLVSVNQSGTGGGNQSSGSFATGLSSNGSFVVFGSNATNLVSGVMSGLGDVFLRNVSAGTTTLVSFHDPSLPSITGNNASSIQDPLNRRSEVSSNGRYVAFTSYARNLATGVYNGTENVFVRDVWNGTTTPVSVNQSGTGGGNGDSYDPSMSADGRYVAFSSDASNLVSNDNNGTTDVFVRDLIGGTTTLVSVNLSGTGSGNSFSLKPVIAANGRYVVFVSYASDLVANDANNAQDVFERDLVAQTTALVSINTSGSSGNAGSGLSPTVVTPDGRYVAFDSAASDLVAGDTAIMQQVYLRDMVTGTTQMISVSSSGVRGNYPADIPVLTPDGRYVAFESFATNLAPGITKYQADVFVRDAQLGTTTLVSINATGSGAGNSSSQYAVISDNGRYVAFNSYASDLVSNDTNNSDDVFVRDLVLATTTLVSINYSGTASANADSDSPAISSDGRYVSFMSYASDLVQATTSLSNVYRRDLSLGTTTLLSLNNNSYSNEFGFNRPMMTPDGQRVVFASNGNIMVNGDFNQSADVFLWNNDVPPVANAGGPYAVNEGGSVGFTGTGSSDPDGSISLYEWNFNYDGTTFHTDATGATPTFSASGLDGPSTQTVALRVTDEEGQTAIATTTLTLNDVAPTVTAPANQSAYANNATSFNLGSFSDPDADGPWTVNVAWGDSSSASFSASAAGTLGTQNHTYTTLGSYTVTVTVTNQNGASGQQTFAVSVSAAAASSFVVSGFPLTTTAGVAGTVTVTARDAYGNTATGYTGTVYFTSSDAQAVLPANYGFVAADAGVHTFSTTLKTAGSQSLTVSDTLSSTITGSQTGITVNPAAATSLAVSGFPSPSTAGVAGSVTVTAKDPYGNTATSYTGTVSFTSSDAQATLPANYTFVTADAGVHAFTATLKTAGSQSLTATDTGTSTITGSQTGITVNPAAADHLVFGVQPSNTVAGAAITPAVTVQILDRFNNLVTSDNSDSVGMVIGTNPSNGTLSGTTTVTASGGVATFSTLSINKVGSSYTLSASSGSLTGATSTTFGITPAAASQFTVTGIPSSVISGQAQNFTVTALDSFGNTATGYAGTVRFSSTDTAALLPANYTYVAADAGMHTFSATLETAGTQSLTATDTVTSSITGTEAGILVKPSSFLVSGFPSSTNAGAAQTFSVTAKNANGTTATGYMGTVHFTSSDAQAVLPADSTLTSGTGTFSATLKTAGTQSITATDTVTSTITGTQSGITVNALAASTLTVAGYPSTTTAGVANNFTVTAKDVYGNTATGYRGTVKFTSSDTKAALPGNYTFTSTDSGVHTFSATLKTVGTQSITATDAHTSTITGTQSGITVNPASASTFSVTGFPSPVVAGTAGSFTATALDAYGNVATGYLGTVKFSSSDPKATLPANYTFVVADSGVHTFTNGATLKTAGTKSITATDTVTSSIRGTQNGIVVNAASTSMLLVNGFPSPITAGTAGSVTVTAADTYGNKTTGYLGTVHFTSTDAQAVLPANYTFTTTDSGVHTFTNGVTLKTAGNQSITATDTVTSSITGKQTVGVNPAAAATLQVSGYPSPTTAGVSHTFTVKAKDAYGNVATGYLGTVTFTSSDSKAVLPANYTFVAGDHGVHTFSATFKTAGTQSLTATDTVTSSITGTQSGIVVNAAAASILVVSGYPSPITHGTSGTFTVTAEDAYGNVATGYHGTVKFSSSDTAASLPANYTFTATDAGVHTFTATLNTVGTQSITTTDTVTSSITGTQSGIQVTAAAVDRLFRDWSPGSAEVDDLPELLDNPEAAEQLALALISSSTSAGAVAGEGNEEIRGGWGAGNQIPLGAAVALLGLHWRDGNTRRPVSRTRACTGLADAVIDHGGRDSR